MKHIRFRNEELSLLVIEVLITLPFLRLQYTRKASRPCLGWGDVINKNLKEMGASWEDAKREA